jgi:hypothetical protein
MQIEVFGDRSQGVLAIGVRRPNRLIPIRMLSGNVLE